MYELNGAIVKQLRELNNITQTQLGEFLGISQPMVAKCEKGERSFSIFMFYKLADLFSVDVEVFEGGNPIVGPAGVSFRAAKGELTGQELEGIAVFNRIARNFGEMDGVRKET